MEPKTASALGVGIVSVVTPLVFPQIPLPIGIGFYTVAGALLIYAGRDWIGAHLPKRWKKRKDSAALRIGPESETEPREPGSLYREHRTPEEARAVVDMVLDSLKPKFTSEAWRERMDGNMGVRRLGRIGRAKDPDVDLLLQEARHAERRAQTQAPKKPRWIPFHKALHYLVYDSRWASKQPAVANEDEFNRVVSGEMRERLARGEIAARGKRGWDDAALERGTEEIPATYWVDSYFQPWGEIALANDKRCFGGKRGGGGDQWRGIIVDDVAVRRVWPPRTFQAGAERAPTALSIAIEETRAKCAEGNIEIERLQAATLAQRGDDERQAAVRVAAEKMADPYREAVLRLEEAKVTKMSDGEHLTKVECHLRLTSRVTLNECCVWIAELQGTETVPVEAFCRTGRKPDKTFKRDFLVTGGHVQPVAFIKRDLTDIVSNPPFLLLTDKGEYPLADNSEYLLRLELRSEAKYPTLVNLKIVTGVKDALDVSIANQTV